MGNNNVKKTPSPRGVIHNNKRTTPKGPTHSKVHFDFEGPDDDDDDDDLRVSSSDLLDEFPAPSGQELFHDRRPSTAIRRKSITTVTPAVFIPSVSKVVSLSKSSEPKIKFKSAALAAVASSSIHTLLKPPPPPPTSTPVSSSATPSSLSTFARNRFKTEVVDSSQLAQHTASPIHIFNPTATAQTDTTDLPNSAYSHEEDIPDVFKWSAGDAGTGSNIDEMEYTPVVYDEKTGKCKCICPCPPPYYHGCHDTTVTPATTATKSDSSWKNPPRRPPFSKPPPQKGGNPPPSSTLPMTPVSWPTPNGPRTPPSQTNTQKTTSDLILVKSPPKTNRTSKDKPAKIDTVARTGAGSGSLCCKADRFAPPVYISSGFGGGGGGSYSGGGGGSCCGGGRRGQNPLDRLRNVDVIESLSYYPPKDDDCCAEPSDLYEICDDCGEMEYIGEKVSEKSSSRKPVTYTRKQRFNFQHPDDNLPRISAFPGEDGPPYVWPSVANPRFPPHRASSFDELPVGKNPGCKKKKKMFSGKSGLYVYDAKAHILRRKEDVEQPATQLILETENDPCCPIDPCCVQIQQPCQPCQIEITPQSGQPPQVQMTNLEQPMAQPPPVGPVQPQQLMQTLMAQAQQPQICCPCPTQPDMTEIDAGLEANPAMAPLCEMLVKMFMNSMGVNNNNNNSNAHSNTNWNTNQNQNLCNNGFMSTMNNMPGYGGMNPYGNPCCNPCGPMMSMGPQCTMPIMVMPDHMNNGQGMMRMRRRRHHREEDYNEVEDRKSSGKSYSSGYSGSSGSSGGNSSGTTGSTNKTSSSKEGSQNSASNISGNELGMGSDGLPCEDCEPESEVEDDLTVRVSNGTERESTASEGQGDG